MTKAGAEPVGYYPGPMGPYHGLRMERAAAGMTNAAINELEAEERAAK